MSFSTAPLTETNVDPEHLSKGVVLAGFKGLASCSVIKFEVEFAHHYL